MNPNEGAEQEISASSLTVGESFAARFPLVTRVAEILIWPLGAVAVFVSIRHFVLGGELGQDSHAYWLAARGVELYRGIPGEQDAYLYSPAFALAIKPLALLPWPVFQWAWVMIEAVAALWLVKPLRLRWAIPTLLLCLPELIVSNIYLLLAVSAVLALRWPAVWSFPILTKVTTGVGLLWFAFRGEWRRFFAGVAVTAFIVVGCFAVDPGAWADWFRFLIENRSGTPDNSISFILRSVLAVVLVAVAAGMRWPFLTALAMVFAAPVLTPIIPLTILVAVPRLLLMETPRRASA